MAYGLRRHAFVADSYDFWTDQYGVANVKDYRGVGDGIHDDTAAIQVALTLMQEKALCSSGSKETNLS
ncbi:MAG: hypothetical protein AB1556_00445 [Bacillota bacterium]